MNNRKIIKGRVLSFSENPFKHYFNFNSLLLDNKHIYVNNGLIEGIGDTPNLNPAYDNAERIDHGDHVITAGFVDAHVHYPQTAIIASWGKRLIDWLNTYTFPEEMRFGDPTYAAEIAERYVEFALHNGTTSMASYCTIHPESVEAFFTAAADRNMCVVAGKTCMDRNAPDGLRDSAKSAYDDSKALIERWQSKGRAHYAIAPRFSPTSTPEQLEALGALWAEHPECLMQTHLSEQTDEIAWVRELFPNARDYLDTYETFGLLGERGLYGHAIHLEPREMDRLAEVGASVVHCPTSNTFIGSGLFNTAGMMAREINVGVATDTGGGSSFSMLRTMAATYEIAQLRGVALHPAQLLWLATCGSARALHLDNQIGNIASGMAADMVVLDLASTPAIAQRSARAEDIWEEIFPTIMMGDDRAIAATYVAGQRV
ncbi:guanine deaminase [Rhodobacteraceae bacterium HIMB11]|nr:guanine deaminase [Rhodobacteraceae bacterium HIMB11]